VPIFLLPFCRPTAVLSVDVLLQILQKTKIKSSLSHSSKRYKPDNGSPIQSMKIDTSKSLVL
jgi:hypothetical protein